MLKTAVKKVSRMRFLADATVGGRYRGITGFSGISYMIASGVKFGGGKAPPAQAAAAAAQAASEDTTMDRQKTKATSSVT
jgi:hypothetical protein